MKKTIFKGMATAMVTPMTPEGVDYDALRRFIDFQLASGINALVAVGTTGESATLTPDERKKVIAYTIDRVAGRVPIILYNVPSRTGCNLLPATVGKLAEHPNIAAIKEASGNMSQVVELFARCGDKITVYSGEDGLTVPMLAMGGMGTISVLSNVVPKQAVAMTDAFFAGRVQEAADWQCRLLPLINDLFCEVNPIPAKAAVSAMGYGEENIRLPLTPMEPENRAKLFAEMRKQGVNV